MMAPRGAGVITGLGRRVAISLRADKPYYTPGDYACCALDIRTSWSLRFRRIIAELACCERFFSGEVRATRVMFKERKTLSGPGKVLPPGGSLTFAMRIPPEACPTYMGHSFLRLWRIKASVELGLAPSLVADHIILVLKSFRRGGPMTSSASRGGVLIELSIRKSVFLPNELIKGSVALSGAPDVRSFRLELLAIEKLAIGQGVSEAVFPRCLRSLVLPIKGLTPFSLRAPSYSPFESESSSVEYMLRAVARLRARGELVVGLPILVGVPEVSETEEEGSRAPAIGVANRWLSSYTGHGFEELFLGLEDAGAILSPRVGL